MVFKTARMVVAAAMVLGVFALAPSASAGTAVQEQGSCSNSSTWKLKLNPDGAQIEVQFEVDSNVTGEVWRVRIFQNGTRIFHGRRTTAGPSGSFEVRRLTDDPAGTDAFRGKAVNLTTDESCVGRASI